MVYALNKFDTEILNLFYSSYYIREVELAIANEYVKQQIRTPIHLSIGQEVTASAICLLLNKKDYVISHHRSHAHYLAKEGSLDKFIAELYGKEGGCSRGYGGSMHLIDKNKNFLGATAIVSNSIPVGAGFAYSLLLKRINRKVCIFIGDAGTEEGVFYETANFVSLKNLPVIFFCENNQYSVYTHISKRRPKNVELYKIAASLGINSYLLDSSNPIKFYKELKNIIKKNNNKPIFIEVKTYRFCEHTGHKEAGKFDYGSLKDLNYWKKNDPIKKLEQYLMTKKILNNILKKQYKDNINSKIKKAFRYAKFSKPLNYKKFLKENLK